MNKLFETILYGAPKAPVEHQLEQVTDIGIAFINAEAELLGLNENANTLPAWYRGTQFIATMLASLQLRSHDAQGLPTTPNNSFLQKPNPELTYNTFMQQVGYSLLYHGNAYIVPLVRDSNGVRSATVANPQDITVQWDDKRLYRKYFWHGEPMQVNRDIYHIALNLAPGALTGIGPLTAGRLMLEGSQHEQAFALALFRDNATPAVIVELADTYTVDEMKEIQADFEEVHRGRKRVSVVSKGNTVKPITINPVDAEFLETRNFSVEETARLLGIPGFFVGAASGGSLTYATTESMLRLFLVATLNPVYLEPLEQVFSMMISEPTKFDVSEVLKADMKERYTANSAAIAGGWLTPNEVRAQEGLPPIDGGDELHVPTAAIAPA